MAVEDGIRIDELDPTISPALDAVIPAMKDGATFYLTVAQILALADAGLPVEIVQAIDAVASKAPPVDDDAFPGKDSVSGGLRKFFWSDIKAAIKTFIQGQALTLTGVVKNVVPGDASALVDIGSNNAGLLDTRIHGIAIVDKAGTRIGGFSVAKNGGDGSPRAYVHVGGFDGADLAMQISAAGEVSLVKIALSIGNGGTGARNASDALTNLGVSTFIKTLLDDTSASVAQSTLGISTFVKTLLDDADANAFWTTLGGLANNAGNGYLKLPGPGFYIQWGTINVTGGGVTLNFPITFPNALRVMIPTIAAGNNPLFVSSGNHGPGACSLYTHDKTGVAAGATVHWLALGY